MKGSLIIVAFFILGIIAGYTGLLSINPGEINLSLIALCLLMLCVGIGVGKDLNALRGLRTMNRWMLTLPLITVSGTLAGC